MTVQRASQLPAVAASILYLLGILLLFEVLRPFRDLAIDGPIALACCGASLLLTGNALWKRSGGRVVNIVLFALNLITLLAVIGVLILLSSSQRLF